MTKKKTKHKAPKNNKKFQEIEIEIKNTKPIVELPKYGNAFEIDLGKGWLVSFDWHIPVHDLEMFSKFCKFGLDVFPKLEGCIIGGDFINHDAFGKFDNFTLPMKIEEEYACARKVLAILCKIFKRVIIMGGNHDYRFSRYMKGQLDVSWVYAALCQSPNFTYTTANRIEVGDDLVICHPASSYSKTRAKVPSNISMKLGKSVMSGHTHHGGLVLSDNSKYWSCEPGAMLDISAIEYYHRYVNSKPDFVNGFAAILPDRDGKPKPLVFVEGMTDWDFWSGYKHEG